MTTLALAQWATPVVEPQPVDPALVDQLIRILVAVLTPPDLIGQLIAILATILARIGT